MFNKNYYELAIDPNTDPEVLDSLASKIMGTRICVAGNPSTPSTTLELLLDENDYWINLYARVNPNLLYHNRLYLTYQEYFNMFCYRDYFTLP